MESQHAASDHQLMLSVRDGELDRLGELFERHHGPLYGYLAKLTGSRVAAEDISQTVFERILKYRHTYRDDGSFTAWMYHMARRCAADHYRKCAQQPQPAGGDLPEPIDESPTADQSAIAGEDQRILQAALSQLDPDDRQVLLLSRLQELSFAEIAYILECSAGAARVRAHRALRELRDQFTRLQKVSTP